MHDAQTEPVPRMTPSQSELWGRIRSFEIDSGEPDFTFAARLSRENGWSLPFAERVMYEYKRFIFLCMAVDHPCTPSEHIDQAWHLHLVFTRSYWLGMCRQVLPRPLHHGPTQGGHQEARKYDRWYADTLNSYRGFFGTEPPADIWTPASVRFGDDLRWQRVNLGQNYIVPKRFVRAGLGTAAGVVALAALAAAAPLYDPTSAHLWLPFVTTCLVLSWIMAILTALVYNRLTTRTDPFGVARGTIGILMMSGPALFIACMLLFGIMLGGGEEVPPTITVLLIAGHVASFIAGSIIGWGRNRPGNSGGCGSPSDSDAGGGCGGCGGCGGD